MTLQIVRLSHTTLHEATPQLIALLIDAVHHGASVGFLATLDATRARQYWRGLEASLQDGSRWLWVAMCDDKIVGTIQLDLCQRENGLARAEVQKLLVHTDTRRMGIGHALVKTLEEAAATLHRRLLYLDTETGSPAEGFYRQAGYQFAGVIPDFACSPDGQLRPTSLYYKQL
ncbi:GNAT superfamily N-acetyltransferase [Chitinivorax tropicus]|uniref:GNAT superfamily N-acetyltransferase n=1 Tax=Chitinivorax tropicus TaxID=714531 RepID=A0A840MSA9_9PROT|nr:GNAT family N-acetyltransferase [Chitinivorax tropicus]MBB5018101.1 GNAT superfamily N-acetyltransferase [Chitinivorax tropicus]